MVEWSRFVEWAFLGLISFSFLRLDKIMSGLKTAVDELKFALIEESAKTKNMYHNVEIIRVELKTLCIRVHVLELNQAANNCGAKRGSNGL